jgi:hypothetical protein
MWKGFDLLDFQDTKIRFPSMILEKWIIVGADSLWPEISTGRFIKHAAQSRPVYMSCMESKANDPAGVLIHHDHDPVWFQGNGLGPE